MKRRIVPISVAAGFLTIGASPALAEARVRPDVSLSSQGLTCRPPVQRSERIPVRLSRRSV
jgi:hypothetical protein